MSNSPLDYMYMDIVKVFPCELRDKHLRPRLKPRVKPKMGQRLRTCRQKAGWTQKKLAMAVNIKVSQLRAIELDRKEPDIETVNAILQALPEVSETTKTSP